MVVVTLFGMSGWADEYIEQLKRGEVVKFRPKGRSMEPLIMSGNLCEVHPTTYYQPKVGDIVLVTVNGSTYLHRIGAETSVFVDSWCRIENAAGHINGWVRRDAIHGYVYRVSE